MTDLTPNDLSHMSDAEFFALCPQGHHAPGPEPLSPAAQAVLDAFTTSPIVLPVKTTDLSLLLLEPLAAALRAAALVCKRDSAILLSLADELEQ